MASRSSLSNTDIFFCALIAVALVIPVPLIFPLSIGEDSVSSGFCFPSPSAWSDLPILNQSISALILVLCATGVILLNRGYNFIRGNNNSFAAFLLIFCATDPAATSGLSDSLILLATSVLVISLIFSCYKSQNATQEMYIAAALISAVSTILIPAVALLPFLALGMIYMNVVRIKEVIAIGMGLITPWWILFGFGIIDFTDLHVPEIEPIWNFGKMTTAGMAILGSYCVTFLWLIVLWINNSFSLLSGNVKTRTFVKTISVLGLIAPVFMLVDSARTGIYSSLLFLAAAIQTGNFFSIHNVPFGDRISRVLIALCVAFYIILYFI